MVATLRGQAGFRPGRWAITLLADAEVEPERPLVAGGEVRT